MPMQEGLNATLIPIPAGDFLMGSESGEDQEKPVHRVFLDAFEIDARPITNRQFKLFIKACPEWQKSAIIKKHPNAYYLYPWRDEIFFPKGKRDHPVVYINWYSSAAFCNWRSREEGLRPCYDESSDFACDFSADGYRLPTEAEYECASRGGVEQALYPWGFEISKRVANYDNMVGDTTEVGTYAPNGFGLFDMSGNIGHWCQDWYDQDYYQRSPDKNPRGPESGKYRVYRGGPWGTQAYYQRCAKRFCLMPQLYNPDFGFRCVRAV
ncbi:MAG: SUMF1/EgtB/PvdO family nonheme iron enzyme [Alphaproteobacteria bacterium]|nr:SUMF1/EgtB/PvdO family nonheme iron enzyme [Alphaproteobacteria bacterium]